jgi:hypothetical protein
MHHDRRMARRYPWPQAAVLWPGVRRSHSHHDGVALLRRRRYSCGRPARSATLTCRGSWQRSGVGGVVAVVLPARPVATDDSAGFLGIWARAGYGLVREPIRVWRIPSAGSGPCVYGTLRQIAKACGCGAHRRQFRTAICRLRRPGTAVTSLQAIDLDPRGTYEGSVTEACAAGDGVWGAPGCRSLPLMSCSATPLGIGRAGAVCASNERPWASLGVLGQALRRSPHFL